MSLLTETKRALREYSIIPRKRLGQNFLIDKEVLHKMVSYASLCKEDVVLEVGAGLGFLTELLAKRAKQVVAVEIDPKLVKVLKGRLGRYENVEILQGNVMKVNVSPFNKVVSTPPYSISSPLLFWLLQRKFECAVLTFQEEFAERLAASPSSKDYGRLSVTAYYRAEVELLDRVPREKFWPPPKVDSTIVRLKPRKPPFYVEDEDVFFEIVRALFAQRNKKLRNAVLSFFSKFGVPKSVAVKLAEDLPFRYRRGRELAPEEIGLTANEIIRAMRGLKLL